MSRKIRVRINTSKTHLEFANEAAAVYAGLQENSAFFPNPPVSLDAFKTAIDAYIGSFAGVADGGRKARAERDRFKEEVTGMMRKLGHWVEANCHDDIGILRSSGFQAASTIRVAQGPLPQPVILKTQNGSFSGEMVLQVTPLPRARTYELRYATNGADGQPGPWTVLPPYTSSRMSVTGLTPGASYSFQTRAFGKAGLTGWSDAASRIVI